MAERRLVSSGPSVTPLRRCALDPSSTVAVLALAAAIGCAFALGAGPASAATADTRLAAVESHALALGVDVDARAVERLGAYDLVVVDAQGTGPRGVRQLRDRGAIVLGYLSAGTIEPFRPWFDRLRRYAIGYWPEWGEWYARVNSRGYRRALVKRIAPRLLKRGFDGLFLDGTDMIELFPRQRPGMVRLVRGLSRLAHRRGGFLFAQNGDSTVHGLARFLDGWNREDVTGTYDFERRRYRRQGPKAVSRAQAALRRLASHGLLTTATDYAAAGNSRARLAAAANACDAGALPFVSDIALTRVPAAPLGCP